MCWAIRKGDCGQCSWGASITERTAYQQHTTFTNSKPHKGKGKSAAPTQQNGIPARGLHDRKREPSGLESPILSLKNALNAPKDINTSVCHMSRLQLSRAPSLPPSPGTSATLRYTFSPKISVASGWYTGTWMSHEGGWVSQLDFYQVDLGDGIQ